MLSDLLPELIRAATRLLDDRLDRQVNRMRHEHPEFVAAYRRARMIVDYGMGGAKDEASGSIAQEATSLPT